MNATDELSGVSEGDMPRQQANESDRMILTSGISWDCDTYLVL